MKQIRIGIFGAGRGADLGTHFLRLGCEVVALCDVREFRLQEGFKILGKVVPTYSDFDEFLNCEMDAVVIANYFHEHAPYVIKCFKKNLHVFCECISNGTMAEGIMLLDAFKESKSIFMLAENYPQLVYNREIKKVCDNKTLGKILYAEGEYNHPTQSTDVSFLHSYNYFTKHRRNYLPATYYITHSLGPIMWACGATPRKVTAFALYEEFGNNDPTAKQTADRTAIITTLNDDGSVYRITGCASFGGHHNSYRVCGVEGQIETVRGLEDYVMLRYNYWAIPEGLKENNLYKVEWNDVDEDKVVGLGGHGGADYFTVRYFINCIKENRQPEFPFDLKTAVNMSSVAILAHRSVLEEGKVFDIPDFEKEEDRKLYMNDFSSPFYSTDGKKPSMPCCSNKDYKAKESQIDEYIKALKNTGIECNDK